MSIESSSCTACCIGAGAQFPLFAVLLPVAANSRIRRDILSAAEELGVKVYMPPLSLCGDNGAMIGSQAYYEYLAGNTAGMELNAYATKSILGETL